MVVVGDRTEDPASSAKNANPVNAEDKGKKWGNIGVVESVIIV